jgi:glycosyltransferase involved in cell wall biosynthesis
MYARAHALVYVPHYEGFGMPIAEAMKAKLPVICSNIPVFREIANEAAIFVYTQNEQDIKRAMEKSIAMTEKERAQMVALGSQKSTLYSAKACASVMVSAWVRLVQSGHENRDF